MTETPRTSRLTRGIALAELFGLLFLWTATASHVHITPTQSSVRQECQLCIVGTSPVLTVSSLSLPVFDEAVSILISRELHPHYLFCRFTGPPRSPPLEA